MQDSLRQGFGRSAPDVEVVFHPPNHSGLLAREILADRAADVFVSAGWRYVIELHEAGLLLQPEVIAGNRLALLVRPDLANDIRGIQNLARPGLRLVVPPEASDPLGQYIAKLFSIAGMSDAIAEKSRRGEISEHLHGLRDGLISAGVDAAIIYATMLDAFSTAGTAIAIPEPYDLRDRIVFGTGVILRDGHPKPAAERFVAFLLNDLGQAILTAAGFLPKSAVSTTALMNA